MEPPIRLHFVRWMDAWRSQLHRNRKVGGGYRGLKGRVKDSPFSEPRTLWTDGYNGKKVAVLTYNPNAWEVEEDQEFKGILSYIVSFCS